MTTFKAITDVLPHLSEDELRDLNKLVVQEIKYRRKVDAATISRTFRVGNQYTLKGLRPLYLNGILVEVTDVRRTRALVKDTRTGRSLGLVPFSSLEPIAA